MSESIPLFDDYVAHILSADDFAPVFDAHWANVFEDIMEFKYWDSASEDAVAARDALQSRMGKNVLSFNLVVYCGDDVVAWTSPRMILRHYNDDSPQPDSTWPAAVVPLPFHL